MWDRCDVKCQIMNHASSQCSKAVVASPELEYIAHILMCICYMRESLMVCRSSDMNL